MSKDGDAGAKEVYRKPGREGAARVLAGRISCILGLVLAAGGIVAALLGGGANGSAWAVGISLGVLALFFGLAASQGLIPGIESTDRSLPDREPHAG